MITTVKITSLDEALQKARSYDQNYTAWITTVDPEDEKDCHTIKRLLGRRQVLHFHRFFRDYEDGEEDVEFHGPKTEDIIAIVDFLKTLKNQEKAHHLGINCLAGVARSTAIGMIAWMVHGYQPEIALDKVLFVRRCAWPNNRILRMYDEIAGTNSFDVVMKWRGEMCKSGVIVNTAWT
jgi:predicted protein tyrosine phosphatase